MSGLVVALIGLLVVLGLAGLRPARRRWVHVLPDVHVPDGYEPPTAALPASAGETEGDNA